MKEDIITVAKAFEEFSTCYNPRLFKDRMNSLANQGKLDIIELDNLVKVISDLISEKHEISSIIADVLLFVLRLQERLEPSYSHNVMRCKNPINRESGAEMLATEAFTGIYLGKYNTYLIEALLQEQLSDKEYQTTKSLMRKAFISFMKNTLNIDNYIHSGDAHAAKSYRTDILNFVDKIIGCYEEQKSLELFQEMIEHNLIWREINNSGENFLIQSVTLDENRNIILHNDNESLNFKDIELF